MNLPENFHFTASNLQDYLTCERRFELKIIQQLHWPALPSQPVQEHEAHMRNGALFHLYIQQYFLGIPAEIISNLITEPVLLHWWQNFLQVFPQEEQKSFRVVEHTLAGYLAEIPVLAKLDAIRIKGDQWIIYDWKTGFHQPKKITLEKKIQTRLYLTLLNNLGTPLNQGSPIQPDHLRMVYWYPEFPHQEIQIAYSQSLHEENEKTLVSLMHEILNKDAGSFSLTPEIQTCQYCEYRSLCGRGTTAGAFHPALVDESTLENLDSYLDLLDLDQIMEISF